MRVISRRLRKLENSFGLAPETEFSKRLRERIEGALRRVAEFDAREGRPPRNVAKREPEEVSGLSVEQILLRGRMKAFRAGGIANDNAR